MENFFFKKIELWIVLSVFVLAVPLLVIWSVVAINDQVFPYRQITEIASWVKGLDEGEDITFVEKVQEDFLGKDNRMTDTSSIIDHAGLSLTPVKDPKGLLEDSRMDFLYYANPESQYEGFYAFQAHLYLPKAKLGVIIIDSTGSVERVIPVTQFGAKSRLGGVGGISDYGDIFMTGSKQSHVHVYDFCGNYRFSLDGPYHHIASGDRDGFWIWYGNRASYTSYSTGKETKSFELLDLVAANPELGVLQPRLQNKNIEGLGPWQIKHIQSGHIEDIETISMYDPFHHNDIDVLTEYRSELFPMFTEGDLMISFRSINAIIVIDPDSLKIKWFNQGSFSRQHDPDWSENGRITVYDNRSHSDYSKIVQVDPETMEITTLVDGEKFDFHRYAGGNSDYVHPSSALLENGGEVVHISNNETIEFAVTSRLDDGRTKKLKIPYFFSENRFEELSVTCN